MKTYRIVVRMDVNLAHYPLPDDVLRMLEAADRQAALMTFHGREAPEEIVVPLKAMASIECITRQLSGRSPSSVAWRGRRVRAAA